MHTTIPAVGAKHDPENPNTVAITHHDTTIELLPSEARVLAQRLNTKADLAAGSDT